MWLYHVSTLVSLQTDITVTYYNTLKYLVEQYPEDFIRYLLVSEATDIQILKTELNQEPIRADSVTFYKLLIKYCI
ncbi:hypothetical protein A4S05_25420 [Nostoc sp. KVJ20]|nr:hypothetical protein A4S05_25420 [Nostoc sp. KVJ20]